MGKGGRERIGGSEEGEGGTVEAAAGYKQGSSSINQARYVCPPEHVTDALGFAS